MNRGHLWIAYVFLLLGAHVAIVTTLIVASGDPTPRVLPDYYDKAARYDDTMAAERESVQLGWQASPAMRGDTLEVHLVDRTGAALTGATVSASIDPRGRADRTATATLTEAAPGVYRGEVAPGAPGLYVVATTAARGGERFVETATIEREAE